MRVEDFINLYGILLAPYALELCNEGQRRMETNPDPHHSINHVMGLLDELDLWLRSDATLHRDNINFDILLPAICWHDTWKGSHTQTTNLAVFVYRELMDGRGSNMLFKRYVKSLQVPSELKSQISYCILKHSRWTQFFPRKLQDIFFPVKLIEARILCDLDALDAWNTRRLDDILNNYLFNNHVPDVRLLVVGKWWFFTFMQNASDYNYFFDYTKRLFKVRKQIIIGRCIEIWNTLGNYIDLSDPKYQKYLKLDVSKVNPEIRAKLMR